MVHYWSWSSNNILDRSFVLVFLLFNVHLPPLLSEISPTEGELFSKPPSPRLQSPQEPSCMPKGL